MSIAGIEVLTQSLSVFFSLSRKCKLYHDYRVKEIFMPKCIAEANMLYVETPVGVGFSYATDNSSYVAVDDEATGKSINFKTSFSFLLLSGTNECDAGLTVTEAL